MIEYGNRTASYIQGNNFKSEKCFKMFEHCDICHNQVRILHQSVGELRAKGNLRPRAALPSVLLDISVVFALECLSNAGNHRGMYRRNVLIQSKSTPRLSSKNGTYTPSNPSHALDTSEIIENLENFFPFLSFLLFLFYLCSSHVTASATDKLLWIVLVSHFSITASLTPIIRLRTLEAHIVGISIDSVRGHILLICRLQNSFVFQAVDKEQNISNECKQFFRNVNNMNVNNF